MSTSVDFPTTSAECIDLEESYGAHNYAPIPVVFSEAKGVHVYDPEGKHYYDFLSAYSAVNQGHCHPRIVKALVDQASRLTLSSRAFFNDKLGAFERHVTSMLGYERLLPMNTGAEGVETALKIARRWGYRVKGIPDNEAIVLAAAGNFHGRTIAIVSMSTDESCRAHFGPMAPNLGPKCAGDTSRQVVFGDIASLESALEAHGDKIAAFLVEPIQGEAGVNVPPEGYFKKVAQLCKKHNVLLIADEIQSGLGRAGRMLAMERYDVKADITILGKALSGGAYPVSAVLASNEIMGTIGPGDHGSTYGGNPIACAVGIEALNVLVDEKLCERSEVLGKRFRDEISALNVPYIKEVRGEGLMNAIEFDPSKTDRTCKQLCLLLKNRGLLAKPTHGTIIRFSPPLVMSDDELTACIEIIKSALKDLPTLNVDELK